MREGSDSKVGFLEGLEGVGIFGGNLSGEDILEVIRGLIVRGSFAYDAYYKCLY